MNYEPTEEGNANENLIKQSIYICFDLYSL